MSKPEHPNIVRQGIQGGVVGGLPSMHRRYEPPLR